MSSSLRKADYFKAWASSTGLALVVGAILSTVLSVLVGIVGGPLGVPDATIRVITILGAWVIGLLVSYFFFKVFVEHFIVSKLAAG